MKYKFIIIWVKIATVLILFSGFLGCAPDHIAESIQFQNSEKNLPDSLIDGYSRAAPGNLPEFPNDFGSHNDYLTEWWYYTGNLQTKDGHKFGYQLTFFRRALGPPGYFADRDTTWAAEQIYLGHFALSNIEIDQFFAFERYARGAIGLAGAEADPFRVWIHDWEVSLLEQNKYYLFASEGDVTIELNLDDLKGPILHGIEGYSQKGPELGNASYYISQTRLKSTGTVTIEGVVIPVSGYSWMDHEYSTSALTQDQVGWDWYSIQLDNGYELMLYQIRRADGSIDTFSSGTMIAPDGVTRPIPREEFIITTTNEWESPHSGSIYPAGWVVEIESFSIKLIVTPLQSDQELNLTYTYWEGAVELDGIFQNQSVTGFGYVELTGYSGSFAGEF